MEEQLQGLIPISEHNGKQAVSARMLHDFLESKKDFSNWMKYRISQYGLIENQDFEVFNNFGENPSGGRPLTEYALTMDTAKELAMVEGNAKGKQARRYFIECEQKLKENAPHALPQTFAEALKLAAAQAEQIELQQKTLSQQAPKVLFADAVSTSDKSCLIGELAKIIRQNGVELGQNRLFAWLRSNGYLCSFGERYNQPTQRSIEMELFEIKKTTITKPDGTILVTSTTKVTGKGQIYLVNKFLSFEKDLEKKGGAQ